MEISFAVESITRIELSLSKTRSVLVIVISETDIPLKEYGYPSPEPIFAKDVRKLSPMAERVNPPTFAAAIATRSNITKITASIFTLFAVFAFIVKPFEEDFFLCEVLFLLALFMLEFVLLFFCSTVFTTHQ